LEYVVVFVVEYVVVFVVEYVVVFVVEYVVVFVVEYVVFLVVEYVVDVVRLFAFNTARLALPAGSLTDAFAEKFVVISVVSVTPVPDVAMFVNLFPNVQSILTTPLAALNANSALVNVPVASSAFTVIAPASFRVDVRDVVL
jgi:hypothetical protein